jgi:hypothetical protein
MTSIVAAVVLLLALSLGVELEAHLTPLPPNVVPLLRPRKDVAAGSSWKRAWSPCRICVRCFPKRSFVADAARFIRLGHAKDSSRASRTERTKPWARTSP